MKTKEELAAYFREYRRKHRTRLVKYARKYRRANRAAINAARRKKYHTDEAFRRYERNTATFSSASGRATLRVHCGRRK